VHHLSGHLVAAPLHVVVGVECTHSFVDLAGAWSDLSRALLWGVIGGMEALVGAGLLLLGVASLRICIICAKASKAVVVVCHVANALLVLVRSLKRILPENPNLQKKQINS
jgi:hypothetical protein